MEHKRECWVRFGISSGISVDVLYSKTPGVVPDQWVQARWAPPQWNFAFPYHLVNNNEQPKAESDQTV